MFYRKQLIFHEGRVRKESGGRSSDRWDWHRAAPRALGLRTLVLLIVAGILFAIFLPA